MNVIHLIFGLFFPNPRVRFAIFTDSRHKFVHNFHALGFLDPGNGEG